MVAKRAAGEQPSVAQARQYFNSREAAEYLRLSHGAVLKHVQKGTLNPTIRGGPGRTRRDHLFSLDNLEEFVERMAQADAS